jgi:hypothetical protein
MDRARIDTKSTGIIIGYNPTARLLCIGMVVLFSSDHAFSTGAREDQAQAD